VALSRAGKRGSTRAAGEARALTLRRPRAALAVAVVLIAALGIVGLGVEGRLRPTSLGIPGTESARGEALQRAHFGDSAPFAILLRGPAAALERQGPALVRALRRDPRVTTLSPWDGAGLARLRPSPRKALILADFHVPADRAVKETVPYLDRTLEERISPPVTATQAGFATLSRAIQDESVRSTEIAELIALPILLLVLLAVFRSPLAAAIPLAFGALTVTAARGILALAAPHVTIDGFALTVCSMMGLALGVDYALLIVSRFREEMGRGATPLEAASTTRRTAGRTAAFAGSTLVLAMLVTLLLMPGTLLVSLAGAAIVVTSISVAIATLVAPPLLLALGPHLDRWRLGGDGDGKALTALVGRALARPGVAAALIGAVLLLLAAPALAIKTGPPSASQLPASNGARRDAELLDRQIGAGWDAPFVVVAATERGPITSASNMRALARAQRRIAADPGVQAVIGPAQVSRRVAPLRSSGRELLAGRGAASPARLRRLGRGLARAAGGVGQLRGGLARAASGAGLLASGSGRAGEGAQQIASGLGRAATGAGRAVGALGRLDAGSGRLAEGQRKAALGSHSLQLELAQLLPAIRGDALGRARKLRSQLDAAAASDPALAAAAREADRLVEVLGIARNEVQRLGKLATRLHSGQERLAGGGAALHRGASRLAGAAAPLASGLERLGEGAGRLSGGLEALTGGAGALSERLAQGFRASRPLQGGLARTSVRVLASSSRLRSQVSRLRRSSPHIFDSGYFVLSALSGAGGERRSRAARVIDLAHGGQAAQMLVVPRYTFDTPGSEALNGRLKRDAAALAGGSGLQAAVTGGPAQLIDYQRAISARIPLAIAAIALITFLGLVVILRAIPLAAIAVALNLLTVAVAFGVLRLLFDVPAGWPLGGHTYVDAIGAAGIFGIVFGLSIDYAVFLLMRMREAHEAGLPNREAIDFGLRRTAKVITGAAAIMAAVFACFAAAPIATVSQLGVGLTVAVLLDATVVRIVLLPALMLLAGERVWWLPAPLARLLPKVELHAA
jgi:putative drug exporter of the RND superfamily